ncbi:uncharacterized [Tachysurus ichikawai]
MVRILRRRMLSTRDVEMTFWILIPIILIKRGNAYPRLSNSIWCSPESGMFWHALHIHGILSSADLALDQTLLEGIEALI